MNAMIGSLDEVCLELGVSEGLLKSRRLDISKAPAAAIASLAREFGRIDARHRENDSQRKDSKQLHDAAAEFLAGPLAEMLAPVEMPSLENFLFVPGRAGPNGTLLPVQQRVPLGKNSLYYDSIAHSHEARWIGAGGTSRLKKGGEDEDRRTQPVAFYGARFGYDQFDLWRGTHLSRNIPDERQRSARQGMDEFSEHVGGEGSTEQLIPGFLNHNNAVTIDLVKSFGDPTLTSDEMWEQLSIVDLMWGRMNPNRGVSGVMMPKLHRLNMIKIFHGTNKEGVNAWKWAQEAYPWLANIVEDDRMETASESGGPMWQLWSADADQLYRETSPTPMVFGPFETELSTDFILINQDGGVVCKDPRRIFRLNQPAPA